MRAVKHGSALDGRSDAVRWRGTHECVPYTVHTIVHCVYETDVANVAPLQFALSPQMLTVDKPRPACYPMQAV